MWVQSVKDNYLRYDAAGFSQDPLNCFGLQAFCLSVGPINPRIYDACKCWPDLFSTARVRTIVLCTLMELLYAFDIWPPVFT